MTSRHNVATVVALVLVCHHVGAQPAPPSAGDPPANANANDAAPPVITRIQGQVIDAMGRGVSGAVVSVVHRDDPAVARSGQSTSFGDFEIEIEGRHTGFFQLSVVKAGFKTPEIEVEVHADDLEPFIDVVLSGTLTLVGTVIDHRHQQPIHNAGVQLRAMYRVSSTKTDELGRFQFDGLIPVDLVIVAEAPGFGRSRVGVAMSSQTEALRVALKPERVLHLQLLDDRSAVVADAAVELRIDKLDDYRHDTSDAQGQITFRQLPFDTDTLAVRLTHPQFVSSGKYDHGLTFPAEVLEHRATLRMEPAAMIVGEITARDSGRPLNGARLDIGAVLDYGTPHTFTNRSGEYEISSLQPGTVVITATVAGYAPDLKQVEAAPRAATAVNFTMGRGRTIQGTVLDAERQVVVGASLQAFAWRGFKTLGLITRTDAAGRFVIEHAPLDAFRINIFAPQKGGLEDQIIAPNQNDYEFTLDATATRQPAGGQLCQAKAGDPCPALQLKTLKGATIDDELARGKVVLLDFWATWCGPCVAELPAIKGIDQTFGRRSDFLMVSISRDSDAEKLARCIQERALGWHHVHGPGSGAEELSAALGVRGIPCYVVIGRDGRILSAGTGIQSVAKTLEGHLRSE